MDEKAFLDSYFQRYKDAIFNPDIYDALLQARDCLQKVKESGKKMILAGNGASAGIASHGAVDFTKQAGVRSVCFNEAALITALANDCGYEFWVQKALEFYADPGDVILLISSSGKSPNIVNAAKYARQAGNTVISFSGFDAGNPLRTNSDIHFWVDSKAYNVIENTHSIWMLTICDLLIGKAEYTVS